MLRNAVTLDDDDEPFELAPDDSVEPCGLDASDDADECDDCEPEDDEPEDDDEGEPLELLLAPDDVGLGELADFCLSMDAWKSRGDSLAVAESVLVVACCGLWVACSGAWLTSVLTLRSLTSD